MEISSHGINDLRRDLLAVGNNVHQIVFTRNAKMNSIGTIESCGNLRFALLLAAVLELISQD